MEFIREYLDVIYVAAGFLITVITTIVGFIQAAKARKRAKTAEALKIAEDNMLAQANSLIASAETFYKALDISLKAQGESAGPYKKESVMSKLQAYATENKYKFDAEFWSTKIDELVTLTRQVNVK